MIIYHPGKPLIDKKPWGKEVLLLSTVAFWRPKSNNGIVYTPMVKFIDSKHNLSIQNHTKKYESWYFIKNPGYHITSDSIDNISTAFYKKQHSDFVDIPPGYIHAIAAGTSCIEVQDQKDSTNRIYDFPELQKLQREMNEKEARIAYSKFITSPKDKPYHFSLVTKLSWSTKQPVVIISLTDSTQLEITSNDGQLEKIKVDKYQPIVVQLGTAKKIAMSSSHNVLVTYFVD